MGHPIIMGRKTWESIGRPLPGRRNIIVTRAPEYLAAGCEIAHSPDAAIAMATHGEGSDEIFIIGGAELYARIMSQTDRMYMTEVQADVPGDAYFPEYATMEWREVSREHYAQGEGAEFPFDFVVYDRI